MKTYGYTIKPGMWHEEGPTPRTPQEASADYKFVPPLYLKDTAASCVLERMRKEEWELNYPGTVPPHKELWSAWTFRHNLNADSMFSSPPCFWKMAFAPN
jgi:hypothetical protein